MKRRVVITSIGVISSMGKSPGEIMRNLKEKNTIFERSQSHGDVVTSPVKDFRVKDYTGHFKDSRYLNRGAQFAVASAMKAISDSGYDKERLAGTGLFVGTGPNLDIGGEFPEVHKGAIDHEYLQALWILKFLPNTAASAIARLTGIHGENLTVSTACAASLQAIGEAFRKIKDGYLTSALAGGGDSRLSPGGILAYRKAKALYTGDCTPERASRPFDCSRSGFVPGEGGAFFLLEEFEEARNRGAEIYAEICGYGCSMDAFNMTAPDKDGEMGKVAVMAALDEAGITPGQIEAISAHGTGTLLNDEREANLIHDVYGIHKPPVMALKSWIGHTASACGALELAFSLSCMRDGYFPEVRNLGKPCHGEIKFMLEGGQLSIDTMLIENFGFGGQNSALVVKRVG